MKRWRWKCRSRNDPAFGKTLATHEELATFPIAANLLPFARFFPDGRALAVGCFDERGMHIQLVRAPSIEEIAATARNQTENVNSPR